MNLRVDYRTMLKQNRVRRKWTQKKTAAKIGISRSYYSDIENGRTIPSGKTLFAINEVIPIFLILNDVDTIHYRSGGKKNVQAPN